MSDIVWQALIAGVVAIVLAAIQVWAAQLAARKAEEIKTEASKAAVKVEEVRTDLQDVNKEHGKKLDSIAKVSKETHKLVNSSMSIQLELNATVTQRLAQLTKGTDMGEADAAIAAAAKKLYEEHKQREEVISKGPKLNTAETDATKVSVPRGLGQE